MKTVLLTGGTGFIGKNILESYLTEKYRIIAPSRKELNLMDRNNLYKYMNDNDIDIVLHTAASYNLITDVTMFCNLSDAIWPETHLINFSSGAIYDRFRRLYRVGEYELGTYIPMDSYGFSKYIMADRFNEKFDSNVLHLILFGVFGKYERDDRLITSSILNTLRDKEIVINGQREMSYLYVKDLIRILDIIMEHPTPRNKEERMCATKILNVVPDESYEISTIGQKVKNITGNTKDMKIIDNAYPHYLGFNYIFRQIFPDFKFTPIDEAIEEMYKYLKDHLI